MPKIRVKLTKAAKGRKGLEPPKISRYAAKQLGSDRPATETDMRIAFRRARAGR